MERHLRHDLGALATAHGDLVAVAHERDVELAAHRYAVDAERDQPRIAQPVRDAMVRHETGGNRQDRHGDDRARCAGAPPTRLAPTMASSFAEECFGGR